MVERVVSGVYKKPFFSEYDYIAFDFQVIIQASTKGLRPTIPSTWPPIITAVIQKCWCHDTQDRPTCSDLIKLLEQVEIDFLSNRSQYPMSDEPDDPTPVADESGETVQRPKLGAIPAKFKVSVDPLMRRIERGHKNYMSAPNLFSLATAKTKAEKRRSIPRSVEVVNILSE